MATSEFLAKLPRPLALTSPRRGTLSSAPAGRWVSSSRRLLLLWLTSVSARQLQDSGFDFAVPDTRTPTQSGSSRRKARTSQLGSLIRSATRGASRSTPPASQMSDGRGSTTRKSKKSRSASVDVAEVTQQDEEGSATKKRRITSESPAPGEAEDVSVNAEPLPDITEEVSEEENEPDVQPTRATLDVQLLSEQAQSHTFLETPQSPASRRKIVQYSGSAKKPSASANTFATPGQRPDVGQLRLKGNHVSPYRKRKKRRSIAQKIKGHGPRKSPLSSAARQVTEVSSQSESDDPVSASPTIGSVQPDRDRVETETTTRPTKEAKRPVKQRLLNALRKITSSRRSSNTPHPPEPSSSVKKKRGRPRKSSPARAEIEAEGEGKAPGRDVVEPASTLKKRGRPRKSSLVAQQAEAGLNNNDAGNREELEPVSVPRKRGRPRKSSPIVQRPNEGKATFEHDETPNASPPKSKNRAETKNTSAAAVEVDDGDAIDRHDEVGEESAVAPKRRGRPRKSDAGSTATATPKSHKSSRSLMPPSSAPEPSSSTAAAQPASGEGAKTISVGVYRMTGAKNLNLDGDGKDDEALGSMPIPKKSGVNAIDVLNQICGEMIEKNLQRIRKGAQKERDIAKKKEWQEARRVIGQFGEDLDTRLLQMVSGQFLIPFHPSFFLLLPFHHRELLQLTLSSLMLDNRA